MTGRFDLGRRVMTARVSSRMETDAPFAAFVSASLQRHALGDWGHVSTGDRIANEDALWDIDRLLSAYVHTDNTRIWIVTEWDFSLTTVLFPDVYLGWAKRE